MSAGSSTSSTPPIVSRCATSWPQAREQYAKSRLGYGYESHRNDRAACFAEVEKFI